MVSCNELKEKIKVTNLEINVNNFRMKQILESKLSKEIKEKLVENTKKQSEDLNNQIIALKQQFMNAKCKE